MPASATFTHRHVAATVARVLEREASSETTIEVSVDEELNVLADSEYLFRALSNVVRNAIRYAGHAGPIRISARAAEGKVHISVADSGPGVPEHALEEIFAPFYRLDPSRSQETGGVGLGLAIVRACVEACRGVVPSGPRGVSALAALLAAPPSPRTMARLPGTGQTRHFSTSFGEDADYALDPPVLRDNGDGTVTDAVTGLLWQPADGGEMTWEKAAEYCKTRADDSSRVWVTNAGDGIGPHPKTAAAGVRTDDVGRRAGICRTARTGGPRRLAAAQHQGTGQPQ